MIILIYSQVFSNVHAQQKLCEQYDFTTPDVTLSGTITNARYYTNKKILIQNGVEFQNLAFFVNCTIKVTGGIKLSTPNPSFSNRAALFQNCKIFSANCSQLWSGITVEDRHIRLTSGTQIEDAVNAIYISMHNATITCSNTTFNRNFNCITVENDPVATNSLNIITFSGNVFSCTSDLNATYNGANKTLNGISIRYLNDSKVFIGRNASNINLFKDISCGIWVNDANIDVSNCKFENIKGDNNYFWRGHSIFFSSLFNRQLTIIGLGGLVSSPETFKNSYVYDVYSSGQATVKILNCKSSQNSTDAVLHEGIIIKNNNGGGITINSNYFTFIGANSFRVKNNKNELRRIIGLEDCKNLSEKAISNNTFINQNITSSSNLEPDLISISLKNVESSSSFTITNNFINDYITSNSIGMQLENSSEIDIYSNDFIKYGYSNSRVNNRPGIKIMGGKSNSLSSNEFNSDKGIDGQVGIQLISTEKPYLCDNRMYNERISIQLSGMCNSAHLTSNLFGSGTTGIAGSNNPTPQGVIGLNYLSGTTTNSYTNNHTANFWSGTFSDKEARHDGGTFPTNLYLIKSDNYGTNIKFWATLKTPTGNSWLRDNSGTINSCNLTFGPNIDGYVPYCDTNFRNELSQAVLWDNYQKLIQHVQDNNLEDSLGCLESLYDSLMITRIPDYIDVNLLIKDVAQVSSTYLTIIQNYNTSLQSIEEDILSEIEILQDNDQDTLEINTYILDSLNNLYKAIYNSLDSIYQIIENSIQSNAQAALIANQALVAITDYEKNEKFLNRVELNKYLYDTIATEDIDTLLSLSASCINDIGISAIRAHTLLPSEFSYHREPLMYCNNQQSIKTGTLDKGKVKGLTVYPNPSSDFLYIIDTELNSPAVLSIYNIDGLLMKQINNIHSNSKVEINLDNIPSGVYLIEALDKEKNKHIQKFIKL